MGVSEFESNCSGPSSVKNDSVTTTESSLSSETNLLQQLKSPMPSELPTKRNFNVTHLLNEKKIPTALTLMMFWIV